MKIIAKERFHFLREIGYTLAIVVVLCLAALAVANALVPAVKPTDASASRGVAANGCVTRSPDDAIVFVAHRVVDFFRGRDSAC